MKKYLKDFCIRGIMFAWGGPVILVIIWLSLQMAGQMTNLTVNEAAMGIISTILIAFIAAGISIVYQIENLPKPIAGLIQMAVLYVDYLGFYLLNGWINLDKILIFTLCFIVGFAVIWLSIFISVKVKVNKMNKIINKN